MIQFHFQSNILPIEAKNEEIRETWLGIKDSNLVNHLVDTNGVLIPYSNWVNTGVGESCATIVEGGEWAKTNCNAQINCYVCVKPGMSIASKKNLTSV